MYDKPNEDDASLAMEMATINDNVEFMEDRLTSQAAAAEETRKKQRKRWQSSVYGGKFRKLPSRSSKNMDTLMRVIKAEMMEQYGEMGENGLESEEEGDLDSTNLTDDILGLNIKEDEVIENTFDQ